MIFIKTNYFKKYFGLLIFLGVFFIIPIHNVYALTLTPIRLEVSGDPGQTLNEKITLINEGKTPEIFYSSFENFTAEGETGNPTWSTPTDDLGTWMNSTDTVSLLPGEQKNVPFTISIPKNAEPGGHFAGIFWGTTPKLQAGGQVAIGAKTGVLVLLSVSGPTSEKGGILSFGTKDQQAFYKALPIDFSYRFQNNGSDRIKPTGSVVISNTIGFTSATLPANPIEGNILPQSVRRLETSWNGSDIINPADSETPRNFIEQTKYEWSNFAFGHYTAHMHLTYGKSEQVADSSYAFWVFPWELTIVCIVFVILAYILIHGGLRKYNAWVIGRAEKMFEEHEDQMKHIHKKTVLHKIVGPKIKKNK